MRITAALLALLSAGTVLAVPTYDLSWNTVDGGGGTFSTGGTFSLGGTIGQPDAGPIPSGMSGGSFDLLGGFWPVTLVCYCPGDLNGDGKKDGRDIQQFVSCVLSGSGNCTCADMDDVGGVTLADVAPFVTDLLTGAVCP